MMIGLCAQSGCRMQQLEAEVNRSLTLVEGNPQGSTCDRMSPYAPSCYNLNGLRYPEVASH